MAFGLGSGHRLERGAVIQDIAAVHVSVGHNGGTPSVSTQIATLRRLLLGSVGGDVGSWFGRVAEVKHRRVLVPILSICSFVG